MGTAGAAIGLSKRVVEVIAAEAAKRQLADSMAGHRQLATVGLSTMAKRSTRVARDRTQAVPLWRGTANPRLKQTRKPENPRPKQHRKPANPKPTQHMPALPTPQPRIAAAANITVDAMTAVTANPSNLTSVELRQRVVQNGGANQLRRFALCAGSEL
jgi:hypothetical protein